MAHCDGGLIINGIDRQRYPGGPFFSILYGGIRMIRIGEMRDQCKVDPTCSVGRDQEACDLALSSCEQEVLRRQRIAITTGRLGVAF